jgi:hypothetical protein
MILRSAEQVRRVFLILAGFTLLLLGITVILYAGSGHAGDLDGLGSARCRICLGRAHHGRR